MKNNANNFILFSQEYNLRNSSAEIQGFNNEGVERFLR
jgi:hypothetical protein